MKKVLFLIVCCGFLFALEPEAIIKKCAACHGQKMERPALGKSQIVSKMSESEIETSLKGYRSGSLNKHGLGATMKAQVQNLSDEDIHKLASYIANTLSK